MAVHYQTIDSRQIAEEATKEMTISAGVLEGILMNVAKVVRRHLRNGDKVRLKEIGLLKLEIESEKVDNLKDFRAKKHIRGVRLHLIPESYEGSQELYKDITFEKDRSEGVLREHRYALCIDSPDVRTYVCQSAATL